MKNSALLLLLVWLPSCAQPVPNVSDSMQLFSPDSIHIKAGTEIQTKDGLYKAQVDEIWHSHDQYMKRVQEVFQ